MQAWVLPGVKTRHESLGWPQLQPLKSSISKCFFSVHFYFFSQVGISAFDPSLPGVQNRTEDCILETIGKPVFKRFSFQSISIYSFPSRCLNGFLWISSTFQIFPPLSVSIFLQVHSRWARRVACWSTGWFKIRLIWDWVDLWLDWFQPNKLNITTSQDTHYIQTLRYYQIFPATRSRRLAQDLDNGGRQGGTESSLWVCWWRQV